MSKTCLDVEHLSEKRMRVAQSKAVGESGDLGFERSVSDEIELPWILPETAQCMEQCSVVLLELETGDHHEANR